MISFVPRTKKFRIIETRKSTKSIKMFKIKRLLHIHIVLIYFTFIYSQGYSSSHKQVQASQQAASVTTTQNSDEMTEEQIRNLRKEYKALAMERLFDIKGKPSRDMPKNPNTKLFVPSAILKQYVGFRDEVREVVPDDREFYGKINIDAVGPHENVWSAHIGDYDVEVDMPSSDDGPDSESFRREGARHIAHLPLARDPEEVPPKVAPQLPPQDPGQTFTSVHLTYNLSQEIYSGPTAAEDFKRAELRLTRDKIYDCDFNDCPKRPITFFGNVKNRSDETHGADDRRKQSPKMARYQTVYVLWVRGYDEFNDPQTIILSMKQIDTRQTTPLSFDISRIVKSWLENPKNNYGIIVRVTNDYSRAVGANQGPKRDRSNTNKRDTNSSLTNASDIELETSPSEMGVLEHVRLKRAFQFRSDSHEVWLDKQPSIIIWSNPTPTESARRHVKRHHNEQEMQADEPDTTTVDYQQTSTATHSGNDDAHATHATHLDKSPNANSSGSHNKRDNVPTVSGSNSRRGSQPTRASSNGRPSSQQGSRPKGKGRPPLKQSDKCSKRSLNINFDEVGWSSWIIAPHSYYANYCSGDCNWPLSDTQNSTNHAIIQSIYRSVGRLVPKSCCAPVKLGRMAILYQLDGIVQMRLYDDMIVEACGCL